MAYRIISGVGWSTVGAVFTYGSTFIVNIIIANIIGKNVFGEYSIIRNTLLTLSSIAKVAAGITATKHIAEYRSTNKEKAGRILGLCSLVRQ